MLRTLVFSLLALSVISTDLMAQQRGDSARITIGTVERARQVQLDANTGRGALVGGALGWGLARNQSSATQAAAAAAGAGLGAARRNRQHGGTAMEYMVRTGDGSAVTVVTDQREIRVGDCVVVEETGNGANVRRTDPAACQPASEKVVAEVQDDLEDNANRCDEAKQRLFDATTPEEVEVARQVMDILCNE